jgi:hypothetical protein
MKVGLGHWGFECVCAVCSESKNTPKRVSRKRKDLLLDIKHSFADNGAVDPEQIERQLKAYEATYKKPASEVPRVTISNVYIELAKFWGKVRQPGKSVAMALKGLECLGFVIKGAQLLSTDTNVFHVERWGVFQDDVVQAWICICDAYEAFAPHLLEKAKECARLAYKMRMGEDVTFDTAYEKKLNI